MGGRGAASGKTLSTATRYHDFDHTHESQAAFKQSGEDWWNSLTEKDKEFFKSYTSSGYKSFNAAVRAANGDPSKMTTYGKRLQMAIDKLGQGELPKATVFHRQSTSSLLGIGSGASYEQIKAQVGKVVTDYSITSARSSKYHNNGSGMFGNVNYHISTPAGKGVGAYVANHSSCGSGEDEFLFRPGSAYRVDRVWQDSYGNPHIAMTYMGNIHEK